MGQCILTRLALMQLHRNIQININNLVDGFVKLNEKAVLLYYQLYLLINYLYNNSNYQVKIGAPPPFKTI